MNRKHLGGLLLALLAAAGIAAPATAAGTNEGKLPSVMWVGNSLFYYNNSMHNHVTKLLTAAVPAERRKGMHSSLVGISGGHLTWHNVEGYLKPRLIGGAGDDGEPGTGAKANFDLVMLADCSTCPTNERTRPEFHSAVRKHSATIRRFGAEPVLFMTWAYAGKPEMTPVLAEQYTKAGHDNKATVVPAGLAFAASRQLRPELQLTIEDNRHPTVAGTYLGACVVIATLFGVNPVGNSYHAGLTDADAQHLQSVAWKTVQEYRAANPPVTR